MFCQWLKLIPAKPTMLFRGPALLVLVLAAVACNGEGYRDTQTHTCAD